VATQGGTLGTIVYDWSNRYPETWNFSLGLDDIVTTGTFGPDARFAAFFFICNK
jgi:hypothetical protein